MLARNEHTRPSLSVSMIVKNEAEFLEGCLESVRAIADEIIVVDTGSTDATKDIAFRYGARVYDYAWNGDFAAARNFSLQHCSGDWVLYIDADERLTPESVRVVRELISRPKVGAYALSILNPQTMQQGTFHQQNAYPRLFRRLPGVQFEGRVHEQIWPSLKRLRLNVLPSPLTILHLGYSRGYDVVQQKAERNLELLRKQLVEHPDDAYALFQMGNSLVVLQRYDEAKEVLQLAVAHPTLDKSVRASCYNLLAEVTVRSHNMEDAVSQCLRSIELVPTQVMARWFLALLYFDLREYDRAIEALKQLLPLLDKPRVERSSHISSDLVLTPHEVYKRLALTCEAGSKWTEALDWYVRVLEGDPDASDALQGVLRCEARVGDARVSIAKLEAAARVAPQRHELLLPLAMHHYTVGDHRTALSYVSRAMKAEPTNGNLYALAIRWHTELGEMEEAKRWIAMAEEKQVRAFELHKTALQFALAQGDIHAAFGHLELMAQTSDADLTPLRSRLSALAAKLSAPFSP